ncbi:MAG TPA: hypothetical protein VKB88_00465 [Bryobacteraceae bacterium]|nr:hypothetical protein [Bryobacteraceae bacterium]
MTRDDLTDFTRRLSMLSADGVERVYETTYKDCRYDGPNVPPATAIQQLAQPGGSYVDFAEMLLRNRER